ncbi:uncharacterized protein [Montipora capricornis]|uniref:uncharacterized protein n=1 Tax=Montipora capricornis TaxID=246305 RepID=UPI0035F1C345
MEIPITQVDDSISNMELERAPLLKSQEAFSMDVHDDDIYKIDVRQGENGKSAKKDHRGQIPHHQKKDLYAKLDVILVSGLHQHFEFCPGHSISRLEMVNFLTSLVQRHLEDCPELQKILDLRDTVLTGRLKRAFPGVEFKRKQIKEDHYRKVWMYVNIRRKRITTPGHTSESTSTSSTRTVANITSPVIPTITGSSSPSVHTRKDHPASLYPSYEESSPSSSFSFAVDDLSVSHDQGSPQHRVGFDNVQSHDATFSREHYVDDGNVVELDREGLQKWILAHYKQDSMSYVPVQDVIDALKKNFNANFSYKQCHEMILSALASPKNPLIPRKPVRVGCVGNQYVYRGIAPLNKPQDVDETEPVQPTNQSEKAGEETYEAWNRRIRDITEERDQALKERNQALAALMELEKEHAEAMRTVESLRLENSMKRVVETESRKLENETTKGESTKDEVKVDGKTCNSNCGCFPYKFGDHKLNKMRDGNAFSHGQCDYSLLQEVVTQAKEERDFLLKGLEIVKDERNSYLNRLHALEKDNQRLRDSVYVRHADLNKNGLLDDLSLHFQTTCHDENSAKDGLSSVLSHLRSKRKQVTPSRLNKSPKFDHSNFHERNAAEVHRPHLEEYHSPTCPMDSGVSSPWKPEGSNAELRTGEERL